jgi:hypothetical protein
MMGSRKAVNGQSHSEGLRMTARGGARSLKSRALPNPWRGARIKMPNAGALRAAPLVRPPSKTTR